MTPSNPSNSQPLIYRIMDALGVTHLVACINHTHEQSEVDGLVDALAGKAPANYIPTQIEDDEDQVSSVKCFGGDGIEIKAPIIDIKLANAEDTVSIVPANAPNIARAFRNPDSTPTANSDNLVTSGGVKEAIDAKYRLDQVDENDEQEAHFAAIAEDDDVYFRFQLKDGNTTKTVLLTVEKMDNFARAISDPDTTPTASSDNLITSGAVADALSGKANTNHTHSYNENGLYVHLYTKNAGDNPLVAVANTIFNNNGNPYLLHIAVKNNTGNSLAINDMIIGNGTYVIPSETNNSIPDGYIGIIDLYRFTGDSNYYATVSTLFPISA